MWIIGFFFNSFTRIDIKQHYLPVTIASCHRFAKDSRTSPQWFEVPIKYFVIVNFIVRQENDSEGTE
jgi:hypothetical protein